MPEQHVQLGQDQLGLGDFQVQEGLHRASGGHGLAGAGDQPGPGRQPQAAQRGSHRDRLADMAGHEDATAQLPSRSFLAPDMQARYAASLERRRQRLRYSLAGS